MLPRTASAAAGISCQHRHSDTVKHLLFALVFVADHSHATPRQCAHAELHHKGEEGVTPVLSLHQGTKAACMTMAARDLPRAHAPAPL